MMEVMAQRTLRWWSRLAVARRLDVQVEGLEHLPREGALLIACRHVHHLYDGCLLLSAVPRPLHILVALDWVGDRRTRLLMEWACGTARWPVVLRAERLQPAAEQRGRAYSPEEVGGYVLRAARAAVGLLRAGEGLVIFPEAYPAIDPHASPRAGDDDFLPFRPGFIRLAEMAQRDGRTRVAIVPAGLAYRRGPRWRATLRFAAPLYVENRADRPRVAQAVEERVRRLSAPAGLAPDPAHRRREYGYE